MFRGLRFNMFKKFIENIIDTIIDKDIIVSIIFNRITNHTELNNTEKVNKL